jgi:hypothetical protein
MFIRAPQRRQSGVIAAVRYTLMTTLLVIARALGGAPKIPDPMKRNQVTQVDRKR